MLVCLAALLGVLPPGLLESDRDTRASRRVAVHSLFSPNPRDASSDLYRVQEDANLKLNIAEGGPLGKGFGVPINYALPIVDIRDVDPLITWIPHDGLLYIPMRMGVLGAIAFWCVLAAGMLGRVPAPALSQSRGRAVRRDRRLPAVRLRSRGLQGSGLLLLPGRAGRRHHARAHPGGASPRGDERRSGGSVSESDLSRAAGPRRRDPRGAGGR